MNRYDSGVFRNVFDPLLTKDGFIWRYQTYLHVNFDQCWYLAIWPKVYGNGYDYNLHFWLGFFHEDKDLVKTLKALHSYQGNELFKEFPFFNPPKYSSDVSLKDFQEAAELYCSNVRGILKKIRTPYDAYLFRREYPAMWRDQVEYEDGVNLINVLLCIQRKQEALNLISLMKKRVDNRMNFSYEYERNILERWPKYYEETKKRVEEMRKSYLKTYDDIECLKNVILNEQYRQMMEETEALMRSNAEKVKKGFSKKEISWMEERWNESADGNTGSLYWQKSKD